MLRLNGLTEYWKGLSGRIWNVEDDGTTCDILIQKYIPMHCILSHHDTNEHLVMITIWKINHLVLPLLKFNHEFIANSIN